MYTKDHGRRTLYEETREVDDEEDSEKRERSERERGVERRR